MCKGLLLWPLWMDDVWTEVYETSGWWCCEEKRQDGQSCEAGEDAGQAGSLVRNGSAEPRFVVREMGAWLRRHHNLFRGAQQCLLQVKCPPNAGPSPHPCEQRGPTLLPGIQWSSSGSGTLTASSAPSKRLCKKCYAEKCPMHTCSIRTKLCLQTWWKY